MKFTYYGVRGSCPTSSDRHRRYGGNTSCVLVETADTQPIVLDLGTGVRELGLRFDEEVKRTGVPIRLSALVSHLHYDHIIGLPFFTPLQIPGTHVDLHGPSQDGAPLRDVLSDVVKPPFFPVEMKEFRGTLEMLELDGTGSFEIDSVTVTARRVPHRGDTMGFRLECGDQRLAYLPDHQAPADRTTIADEVLELCDGVDVLIHDAQYTDDEFVLKSDWGHSTAAYAVHVASTCGVKRLHLFHHDPNHVDKDVDRLLHRARRLAVDTSVQAVFAATEGHTTDLDHS